MVFDNIFLEIKNKHSMTESVVVTDAESAGGNQEFDLVANTTGSMKVIITKENEIIN